MPEPLPALWFPRGRAAPPQLGDVLEASRDADREAPRGRGWHFSCRILWASQVAYMRTSPEVWNRIAPCTVITFQGALLDSEMPAVIFIVTLGMLEFLLE